MEKLITNYALDDTGVTTLRMLANILKIKDARIVDAPFNLLLTYNDEHEVNRFATELEQYISACSGIRRVYQCTESELDTEDVLNRWRRNARAFFIFADSDHTLEQRKTLGTLIEEIPECIVCMCISDDECQRALKEDDHLYYRVFPYHIHVTSASASVITGRFLSRLAERSFAPSEAFVNAITEYIKVVYPKADLKDDAFIQDLLRRVINNHFGSGNESSVIEESSVPFYIREDAHPEKSIPAVDPKASMEVSSTSVAGEETLSAEMSNAATDKVNESAALPPAEESKKSRRGPKSKKNKIKINDDFRKDIPRKGCKRAKTCNIVLMSLSTFPIIDKKNTLKESTYYYNGREGDKYLYQLEPVIRMLSKELLKRSPSDCLDHLVILCTDKVKEAQNVTMPDGTVLNEISPLGFFKERIREYLNPDRIDDELFIVEDVDEHNASIAIKSTVDTLRNLKNSLPVHTKIKLFVDRHGGFRGVQQYLDAILSLLRDEFPDIESYDVQFDGAKSNIIKADNRSIFDFVSGINEFTNYGRIDSLKRYYQNSEIMQHIYSIAEGIQLCDVHTFENGLNDLKDYFARPSARTEVFLSIFEDSIKADYKSLLNDDRTTVAEIEWCLEKGFYQQALTLVEGAMPKELCDLGVITYSNELRRTVANNKPNYETNAYVFNHSIATMISRNERREFIRSEDFRNTSIGNRIITSLGISKAEKLFRQTCFSDREITVDPRHCSISFRADNHSRLYVFMLLHCALKDLRNRSNHAANEPLPVSLDKVKQMIRQYITWAKEIETYARQNLVR